MLATHMPAASFYRRPLPGGFVAFASPEGRTIFREALDAEGMEGWFVLAEQFHTQSDPAFCGLGSLVVALNALEIDPGRIWKGPWRWYTEDLLDCCLSLDRVREKGVTIEELACLARCNGARAGVRLADAPLTIDAFREAVRHATSAPGGPVLIASYSRTALGQTGSGHFSPIGGYHPSRDLVLLMDVARFKYPPHWVPVSDLLRAMLDVDSATGRSRGWIELSRSDTPLALLFRLVLDRHELTPEHQAGLERLLAALRGTAAWNLASSTPSGEDQDDLARAAATALLLALPDAALEAAGPSFREELACMRMNGSADAVLAAELRELHAQLEALTRGAR